ncbi:MAG: hypothetical protein NDI94_01035 [Candidatus Woesearchaeota archaeon]|nr:hypothetical protein [Candidatus Woesearchaeota archaeon]
MDDDEKNILEINPIIDPYQDDGDQKHQTFYELPLDTRLSIWNNGGRDAVLIGAFHYALFYLEDGRHNRFGARDHGMPVIDYIQVAVNAVFAAERQNLESYECRFGFAGQKNQDLDFSYDTIRLSLQKGLKWTIDAILDDLIELNLSKRYLSAISQFADEFSLLYNLREHLQHSVLGSSDPKIRQIVINPEDKNFLKWDGELKDFAGDISEDALADYYKRAAPLLKEAYAGLLEQIKDSETSGVYPIFFEGDKAVAIWDKNDPRQLSSPLTRFHDSLDLYSKQDIGITASEFFVAVHKNKAYDMHSLRY